MSVNSFEELTVHVGHPIECVTYRDKFNVWNVAIECVKCGMVIIDFDNPKIAEATDFDYRRKYGQCMGSKGASKQN